MEGKLYERLAILGTVDPETLTEGLYGEETYYSDYADMSRFNQIMALIMVGAFAAGAKLDAKLQEAKTAAGGDVQDIEDKAITQLTEAGSDEDKQAIINLRADELSEGYRYVRLAVTVTTDDVDVSAVLLGGDPMYAPATDWDLASVDEIVS